MIKIILDAIRNCDLIKFDTIYKGKIVLNLNISKIKSKCL